MRRSMPKESPAARRQKACAVPSPIWKHGSTKKPSKQEQNRERTIRISSRNSPTRSRRLEVSSGRSEEHTSELQSLTNLVCRLLLEKKKKKEQKNTTDNTN